MKFTTTINFPDGKPLAIFYGNTQEEADMTARYTSACVKKFNSMPLEAIEDMPESGVQGLAIEYANGCDAIEVLEGILSIATEQSESAWIELRHRFIIDKKQRQQQTH